MASKVFSLEVLPAKEGDCLILRYGTKTDQKVAVIDGGPDGVYDDLKTRLKDLKDELGIASEDAMPLSWLMVSHIDSDHTTGLLQLTEELGQPGPNRFVKPARLWHNTFNDIIGDDGDELEKVVTKVLGTASLSGEKTVEEVATSVGVETMAAMVLLGVPDGMRLKENIEKIRPKVKLNDGKGGLVIAQENNKAFSVGDGLSFRVIGPMLDDIKRLQEKYREELEKPANQNAPEQALMAAIRRDPSVTNSSSLVILAEFGGKSILFTGDARSDKIRKGMKLVGLGDTLHVDILKGQHHGSENNFDLKFFQDVTADHYVFSGNGLHGNPERITLELLQQARPDDDYHIHLTYEIGQIDAERQTDWEGKGKVWSQSDHSLEAFFEEHPEMLDRVVPIGDNDLPRHRIDLLGDPG